MRIILYLSLMLIFILSACQKEALNERKLAGVWNLERITTVSYDSNGNETVSDSVIANAAMQLQNVDGLDNPAYFENWNPIGSGAKYWSVNFGKLREVSFYFQEGFATYIFNVDKISNRKLELTYYNSDGNLNVNQKVTWYFKKD